MDDQTHSLLDLWERLQAFFEPLPFQKHIPEPKYLSPEALWALSRELGGKMKETSLPFWSDWERGLVDLSIKELWAAFDGRTTDEMVWILFDDCFKSGKVFEVPCSRLSTFAENYKSKHPATTLFEPFDHLFYFPEESSLLAIHHEGKKMLMGGRG